MDVGVISSNTNPAITHAAEDKEGRWRPPHNLAEHLTSVATLAADFARPFGAEWARLAGLWIQEDVTVAQLLGGMT